MIKNSSYFLRTKVFLGVLSFLSIASMFEVVYLFQTKAPTQEAEHKKIDFVKLSTLPDLAISTEATYIRHRSLATVFSTYKDDGALREYFPSAFAYAEFSVKKLHSKEQK